MTHTEFTEKEALVLDLLGLPTTIDEILDLNEDEQNSLCDTIHHEMLGPGVSNNELNEYGSVCWWLYTKIGQAIDESSGIDPKALALEYLAHIGHAADRYLCDTCEFADEDMFGQFWCRKATSVNPDKRVIAPGQRWSDVCRGFRPVQS